MIVIFELLDKVLFYDTLTMNQSNSAMNKSFNIPNLEGDHVAGPICLSVSHDQEGFIFYKIGNATGTKHFVFKVRQHVKLKVEFIETLQMINFSFQSKQTIVFKLTLDFFTTIENFFIQAAKQLDDEQVSFVYIECIPKFNGSDISIVYSRNQIQGSLVTSKQASQLVQKLFNAEKKAGEDLFLLQLRDLLKQLPSPKQ